MAVQALLTPVEEQTNPSGQGKQEDLPVEPALDHIAKPQPLGVLVPERQKVPSGHIVQAGSQVPLPEKVPAGQADTMLPELPVTLQKLPAGHMVHSPVEASA